MYNAKVKPLIIKWRIIYKLSLNKDNSYKYVGLPSEIPIGKSKSISIKDAKSKNNINIAIFNISGRFYAISDSCAHEGGALSKDVLNSDMSMAWMEIFCKK